MLQEDAMDYALATDGYFFSAEPFSRQTQIEATQLACLLGCNQELSAEVILEAHSLEDGTDFQLALTGELHLEDRLKRRISQGQLRELPLDQLSEAQLTARGWTLIERPYFVWMKQQQPIGHTATQIETCAIDELNSLRQLLSHGQAA